MKRVAICFIVLTGVVALTVSPAEAASGAVPVRDVAAQVQHIAKIEQRFGLKQTKVASCSDLSLALHWGLNDLQYMSDGDLVISGIDQLGRSYRAVKATNIAGCEIWSADLNGNGTQDLIILTPGEDSSGGYDAALSIIFFDKNGYPFPWKAIGKFTADENGVQQIVSAPTSTSHAGVIVPTREGLAGPNANLAFQLYAFSPSVVEKVSSKAIGVSWPTFANPTPQLIAHQKAASLSFNQNEPVQSEALRPDISIRNHVSATSKLVLSDGQRLEPPAILVEDSANGSRVINFDPIPEDIEKLVSEAAQITPMGQSCDEEECRPLIWITRP